MVFIIKQICYVRICYLSYIIIYSMKLVYYHRDIMILIITI